MSLTIGIPEKKGQKYLCIFVNNVAFEKRSNYFMTIELESSVPGSSDAWNRRMRTEVQRNTRQPQFKTRSFSFKLPNVSSPPSKSPQEPFTNPSSTPKSINAPKIPLEDFNPSIKLQAFEVVQGKNNTGGAAILIGTASLPLGKYMHNLMLNEKVQAELMIEKTQGHFTTALSDTSLSSSGANIQMGMLLPDSNDDSNNLFAPHQNENNTTSVSSTSSSSSEENGTQPTDHIVGKIAFEVFISESVLPFGNGNGVASPTSPKNTPFNSSDSITNTSSLKHIQHTEVTSLREMLDDIGVDHQLPNQFLFTLTIHCAANLPLVQQDVLPSPFVTCKTTKDAKEKKPARAATYAAQSTRNAVWHEKLAVELEKEEAQSGVGLFVSIIDCNTKKYMGKCIIPVDHLVFGEQYNLGFMVNKDGAFLLASLTLETYVLNEISYFRRHNDLCKLQVLIKGFENPIMPSNTVLMAVVHIVDDGEEYQKAMSRSMLNNAIPSIPFTKAFLDDPDAFHVLTPSAFKVVMPSDPSDQIIWNEVVSFNITKDNLFQPKAALAIDYYRLEFHDDPSKNIIYSGFSVLFLEDITNNPSVPDGSILSFSDIPVIFTDEVKKMLKDDSVVYLSLDAVKWENYHYLMHLTKDLPEAVAQPMGAVELQKIIEEQEQLRKQQEEVIRQKQELQKLQEQLAREKQEVMTKEQQLKREQEEHQKIQREMIHQQQMNLLKEKEGLKDRIRRVLELQLARRREEDIKKNQLMEDYKHQIEELKRREEHMKELEAARNIEKLEETKERERLQTLLMRSSAALDQLQQNDASKDVVLQASEEEASSAEEQETEPEYEENFEAEEQPGAETTFTVHNGQDSLNTSVSAVETSFDNDQTKVLQLEHSEIEEDIQVSASTLPTPKPIVYTNIPEIIDAAVSRPQTNQLEESIPDESPQEVEEISAVEDKSAVREKTQPPAQAFVQQAPPPAEPKIEFKDQPDEREVTPQVHKQVIKPTESTEEPHNNVQKVAHPEVEMRTSANQPFPPMYPYGMYPYMQPGMFPPMYMAQMEMRQTKEEMLIQEMKEYMEKQSKFIQNLQQDLERRNDESRREMSDILYLKARNTKLMEDNESLQSRLRERGHDDVRSSMDSKSGLDEQSKKSLHHTDVVELEAKVEALKSSYNGQLEYVQNLKEENEQLHKFKQTAFKQEQIIEKLESLLQATLLENKKIKERYKKETTKMQKALLQVTQELESLRQEGYSKKEVDNMKKQYELEIQKMQAEKVHTEKLAEELHSRLDLYEPKIQSPMKHNSNSRAPSPGITSPSAAEILQQEAVILKRTIEKQPTEEQIVPVLDMENVRKQPIRHGSSGSYRRPSPKLLPLELTSPRPTVL